MARGQYKKQGQSQLRGRWHDLNSQRRYRSQTTVSWEQYKKTTDNGKKTYSKNK